GLVVAAMLDQPRIGPDDPVVARALEYILARAQPDGSIRDGEDGILANYNTAICLSALARVHNDPEVAAVVDRAQHFLKQIQWTVGDVTPDGDTITQGHPYFGGSGYGRNGRPDMSNTQFMLQALYDSGVDCEDPAFLNALTFISRCQGIEANDYFPAGTIVNDGGVIYSTAVNKDNKHLPVSYANPDQVDEARAGRPVSGLRGYGSMTYAAFKSFLYADLDRDDPRVLAALDWIQNHYTLEQNPGMPESVKLQGLYYFYLTHARALAAYGNTFLDLADGTQLNWANALIAKLVSLQRDDGSFANVESRWMEDNPELVTAYSVTALQAAAN
ncbi:MAG: prenyltransferase/squalene oxidase repeat-containing protein, partial [Planctomycetota bacterium]